MKTKTDYIKIDNHDFYITNSNNKINLECNEFNMKAGDASVNGIIKINNSIFSLNHSIQDIASDNRFNVRSVLCNDLIVFGNADLPKINSRP